MKKLTVLVTAVGATTGISVIKGLRRQNEFLVRIVGTDTNPRYMIAGSWFCDAFHEVPAAIDPEYVSAMLDICRAERVDILLPIVDPELLVLAEHKDLFAARGVQIVVSDPETVRTCNDKFATYQFFLHHDIPTPRTWLPNEISKIGKMPYPLFVKPRDGVSSINAFRVNSAQELQAAINSVPNLIVQEYVEGIEFTTDVLADLGGHVFAVVPRERIQSRAGISYKGRTSHDERLFRWGKKIAELLEIRGPANLQCMVSGDRMCYLEINPRFSGSLPLTIAAGVNTPLWAIKMCTGATPPAQLLPFKELVMTRYWSEVFSERPSPKGNAGLNREKGLKGLNPEVVELEDVAQWYSTSGDTFDGKLTYYSFLSLMPFFTGKRVLEVGAADGQMTLLLSEHFEKVVVVEGSKTYCQTIQAKVSENVEIHCSLIEEYETGTDFDTIFLAHILEHVEDPVMVLKRVSRWLSPRGRILVAVPNAHSIHRLVAVKMGLLEQPYEFSERDRMLGHRRVYSLDRLLNDLRQGGLQVESTGGIFFKPLTNGQIDQWFTQQMMDGFFALGKEFPEYAAEIFAVCRLPG